MQIGIPGQQVHDGGVQLQGWLPPEFQTVLMHEKWNHVLSAHGTAAGAFRGASNGLPAPKVHNYNYALIIINYVERALVRLCVCTFFL